MVEPDSRGCASHLTNAPVNLAGGFIWTYADIADNLPAYVDAMDAGLQAGIGG